MPPTDGAASGAVVQHTLQGEPAEIERKRPSTLLWCEECEDAVLRSERWDHPHDLGEEMKAYEKAQAEKLDDKVPDHALVDTQTWEVTFHYTCVETVRVEADNKHNAKERAELERTYDGEIMETVHTDRRALGEKSQASIEWLEYHSLLPDDHDVAPEDLEQLTEAKEEGHV